MPDFIFMLTRQDQTIADCLEVFDHIADLRIGHIGFKDIGVDGATLAELNRRIKMSGAVSHMEIVSTTPEACLAAARLAAQIGVDRLMGGTQVDATLEILRGTLVRYLPFPGRPVGHPTKLEGTPEDIAADCRRYETAGCAGVDLLAYRATAASPIDLIRAARAAMRGYLVVAGSISSPERIRELTAAGVDGFTIGSAVLDRSFSPGKHSLRSQLSDVLAVC